MEEKELLTQLRKLKNIKPDTIWKNNNREILLSQISNGKVNKSDNFNNINILKDMLPRQIMEALSQPVAVVFLIFFFVFGASILSLNASRGTVPGDSFYIAKIISEKARSTFAFSEKEKAKLSIEFASNRTKEITQVLAEFDQSKEEKEAKVEKLAKNFKKEINVVKNRIAKIRKRSEEKIEAREEEPTETLDEEIQMFSANLGKDEQGVQISETKQIIDSKDLISEEADVSDVSTTSEDLATSTSLEEREELSEIIDDPQKILEEAEKLFAEEDYNGTLNKLQEVNVIIDQLNANDENKGDVKGESDSKASTTDREIDEGDILGVSEEVGKTMTTTVKSIIETDSSEE